MKRPRIKIPALPAHIVRQYPSSLYKDTRSGRVYTLQSLQSIFSDKTGKSSPKQKEELISPEMKHEQIQEKRWDLNY